MRDGFESFKGNFAGGGCGGPGGAPSIGSLSDNSEQLVLQNPTLEFSRSYTTSVLRTTIPDQTHTRYCVTSEGSQNEKKESRMISTYLLKESYDLSHLGIHRDSMRHVPSNAFIEQKGKITSAATTLDIERFKD